MGLPPSHPCCSHCRVSQNDNPAICDKCPGSMNLHAINSLAPWIYFGCTPLLARNSSRHSNSSPAAPKFRRRTTNVRYERQNLTHFMSPNQNLLRPQFPWYFKTDKMLHGWQSRQINSNTVEHFIQWHRRQQQCFFFLIPRHTASHLGPLIERAPKIIRLTLWIFAMARVVITSSPLFCSHPCGGEHSSCARGRAPLLSWEVQRLITCV